MAKLNSLLLRGRIVGEPELKDFGPEGDRGQVYTARLMVYGMGAKGAPGFIDIAVFNEARFTYLNYPAGEEVVFSGQLRHAEWEDAQGQNRSALSAVGSLADPLAYEHGDAHPEAEDTAA